MAINTAISTDQKVRRFAAEHPDWLPVLDAAVTVAASVEEQGGEFAGAWVLGKLRERGTLSWVPNLRILVTYGLIEKSGPSTRGGRRAYYRMPDRTGVEEALDILGIRVPTAAAKPRFIAAGASTEPPADLARRAGDILYEPRSWR